MCDYFRKVGIALNDKYVLSDLKYDARFNPMDFDEIRYYFGEADVEKLLFIKPENLIKLGVSLFEKAYVAGLCMFGEAPKPVFSVDDFEFAGKYLRIYYEGNFADNDLKVFLELSDTVSF